MGRVLHLSSTLFNQVTKGGQLNHLQKEADSFEKRLREKLKNDDSIDIMKVFPTEKDGRKKGQLKPWKLGELVKSDRVQGILERETSYSTGTGGRCKRLCTMVGRTLADQYAPRREAGGGRRGRSA